MATMTMFPGTRLFSKRQICLNRQGNSPLAPWYPKHPKFDVSAKQDLLLPKSRTGAFEPILFTAIILLTLTEC